MQEPFIVIASKGSVLIKILEGDPIAIVCLIMGIVIGGIIVFLLNKSERPQILKRGETIHSQLEGSHLNQYNEGDHCFDIKHESGELTLEINAEHPTPKQYFTNFSISFSCECDYQNICAELSSKIPSYVKATPQDKSMTFVMEGIPFTAKIFKEIMTECRSSVNKQPVTAGSQ